MSLPRCPPGSRRDKTTKECVKTGAAAAAKTGAAAAKKKTPAALGRCPAGSRRDKTTKECVKTGAAAAAKTGAAAAAKKKTPAALGRCPAGSRRDKTTKECVKTLKSAPIAVTNAGYSVTPSGVIRWVNPNPLTAIPQCPPGRRYNTKTGKCDKIPAGGRKAPANHAYTFRGHTMTGLDGELWISAPKSAGSDVYIWKRVPKTAAPSKKKKSVKWANEHGSDLLYYSN